MFNFTEKQQKDYDFYTELGVKCSDRLKRIDKDLEDTPDMSFELREELYSEKAKFMGRLKWADDKRREVIEARDKYEEYIRKSDILKQKWGF